MESSASEVSFRGVCPLSSRANVVFYLGEHQDVGRTARRLFRHRLEASEYAGLAGAPDDAEVEVGTFDAGLYLEMYQPGTNRYHAVDLVRRSRDDLVVAIDAFLVHERMRRMGLGLRVFARQVRTAVALGVSRIETVGGRGGGQNGYYTWPRFGFDGQLPAKIRRILPPRLGRARHVLDLMESERGRQWWREHGTAIALAFDLTSHSRSRRVLQQYLGERLGSGGSDTTLGTREGTARLPDRSAPPRSFRVKITLSLRMKRLGGRPSARRTAVLEARSRQRLGVR